MEVFNNRDFQSQESEVRNLLMEANGKCQLVNNKNTRHLSKWSPARSQLTTKALPQLGIGMSLIMSRPKKGLWPWRRSWQWRSSWSGTWWSVPSSFSIWGNLWAWKWQTSGRCIQTIKIQHHCCDQGQQDLIIWSLEEGIHLAEGHKLQDHQHCGIVNCSLANSQEVFHPSGFRQPYMNIHDLHWPALISSVEPSKSLPKISHLIILSFLVFRLHNRPFITLKVNSPHNFISQSSYWKCSKLWLNVCYLCVYMFITALMKHVFDIIENIVPGFIVYGFVHIMRL